MCLAKVCNNDSVSLNSITKRYTRIRRKSNVKLIFVRMQSK